MVLVQPTGNEITTQGQTPQTRSGGSRGGSRAASPRPSTPQNTHGNRPSTPSQQPPNTNTASSNAPGGTTSSGGAGSSFNTSLTSLFSNLPADQQQLISAMAAHLAAQRNASLTASGATSSLSSSGQTNGSTSAGTKTEPRIFKEADEEEITSIERPVPIPVELHSLFQEKMYLPIHLFTRANLLFINEQRSTLMKKHHINSTNVSLLDVGHPSFGRELDLTFARWIEAWGNYSTFLGERAEPAVLARWRNHFETLCNGQERESAFPAVLAFDIAERRAYNDRQFAHNDVRWQIRLGKEVANFRDYEYRQMHEQPRFQTRDFRERPVAPVASSSRYAPYERNRVQPFPAGKSRSSAGGTCIICGRTGHFARDCTTKTTAANRPVIARFDRQHPHAVINIKDSKQMYCIAFNSGNDKCRPGLHGTNVKHLCSLCGNEHHNALGCPASA